jgi:hypothetical protein
LLHSAVGDVASSRASPPTPPFGRISLRLEAVQIHPDIARDDVDARGRTRRTCTVPSGSAAAPVSDEHRASLGAAFVEAQLAVLSAIGREAQRTDSYDGPRNVARLTQALSMLRMTAAGGPAPGWYSYMPNVLDEEDGEFGL